MCCCIWSVSLFIFSCLAFAHDVGDVAALNSTSDVKHAMTDLLRLIDTNLSVITRHTVPKPSIQQAEIQTDQATSSTITPMPQTADAFGTQPETYIQNQHHQIQATTQSTTVTPTAARTCTCGHTTGCNTSDQARSTAPVASTLSRSLPTSTIATVFSASHALNPVGAKEGLLIKSGVSSGSPSFPLSVPTAAGNSPGHANTNTSPYQAIVDKYLKRLTSKQDVRVASIMRDMQEKNRFQHQPLKLMLPTTRLDTGSPSDSGSISASSTPTSTAVIVSPAMDFPRYLAQRMAERRSVALSNSPSVIPSHVSPSYSTSPSLPTVRHISPVSAVPFPSTTPLVSNRTSSTVTTPISMPLSLSPAVGAPQQQQAVMTNLAAVTTTPPFILSPATSTAHQPNSTNATTTPMPSRRLENYTAAIGTPLNQPSLLYHPSPQPVFINAPASTSAPGAATGAPIPYIVYGYPSVSGVSPFPFPLSAPSAVPLPISSMVPVSSMVANSSSAAAAATAIRTPAVVRTSPATSSSSPPVSSAVSPSLSIPHSSNPPLTPAQVAAIKARWCKSQT